MRRLRAYSRQNRLATVLTELGKLERTSFLLDYFQDKALRRRIIVGLNKGEALHALARQLFSGTHAWNNGKLKFPASLSSLYFVV